jgi:hypothetical protein
MKQRMGRKRQRMDDLKLDAVRIIEKMINGTDLCEKRNVRTVKQFFNFLKVENGL